MRGSTTRRSVVATILATCAVALGSTAPALAAEGDPYLDQCFATAANGPCVAGGTGQIGGGVAVHPNQRWVYISSADVARINLYDRGARGQLTRRAGTSGCVTPDGSGNTCVAAPNLGAAWDLAIDKDGRNLYAPGTNGNLQAFSINQNSGALTPIGCVGSGAGCGALRGNSTMFAAVVDPVSGNSVYVRVNGALLVLTRNADGTVVQKSGEAGCWTETVVATCTLSDGLGAQAFQLSVSPDGGAVYTTNQSPGGVVIFQRSPDGTLLQPNGTAGGCITTNGSSSGTANRCVNSGNPALANSWSTLVDAGSSFVYVGGISGTTVYSRNKATGLLTHVECYVEGADSGPCKGRVGVRALRSSMVPDGSEFLTADAFGRFGFLRRDGSGRLTNRASPRACFAADNGGGACQAVPTLGGIADIQASADGLNAYATSGTGTVLTLQRDFAPVCQSTTVNVPHNTAVNVPLSCTDRNADPITLQKLTSPTAGLLADTIDQTARTVFYNPFTGFVGTDSFTYRGVARGIASTTAKITLNVTAPPPGGGGGGGVVVPSGIDADGDGFFAGQDCNDGNAGIRPGAMEVKGNRIDENCDGIAEPFPTLAAGVVTSWSAKGSKITLKALMVTQQFPRGWQVKILCKGKPKCKFKEKKLKKGKVRRSASNVITSLKKSQRVFRAGQTVEVWVSAPGFNTKVSRYVLKRNKIPTTQPFCVLPGQTRPQKTCT